MLFFFFQTVAVHKTRLLNSASVCRNVTTKEFINSMTVSDAGQVVYCKTREDAQGTGLYSLHVVENGEVRTVIPETKDVIHGLTFLQIAGREQLLVNHEPHIQLMSPDLNRVERKLLKLKHNTTLCRSGGNTALYVQLTGVEGEWEVRELEVMSDKCLDTQKAKLSLGWEYMYDMCTAGDLLVLCSYNDNSVAGVSLNDWQVKWKMSVEGPFSVCAGTSGSVFVACPDSNTIHQLSLQDGSALTQLPLVPGVEYPTCVSNHNNILFVAHYDAELWDARGQRDWQISQYQFRYLSLNYHATF